jgi:hypothetical protein
MIAGGAYLATWKSNQPHTNPLTVQPQPTTEPRTK